MLDQVAKGNYVLDSSNPSIVSPLAAIPKDDGDVLLIHGASRPEGIAVNDYCGLF